MSTRRARWVSCDEQLSDPRQMVAVFLHATRVGEDLQLPPRPRNVLGT